LSLLDSESEGDERLDDEHDDDDGIVQIENIPKDSTTGPNLIEDIPDDEPDGDVWRGRLRRRGVSFADIPTSELGNLSSAIRSKHVCSMCASPPGKASRQGRDKTRKPRQIAAERIVEGDEMLMAEEDPEEKRSISKIMSGPLANFISLAARDSGFEGNVENVVLECVHPLFLKAKAAASAADNPNWNQAMNSKFANDWWKAAVREIQTLEEMDAWEVVDRPPDANVVGGTWAFKLKRYPDGKVKKFKARFCARGDQQKEGIDFFETYAPVAQWTTVRLMLILEVLLNLKSKQGDVTAAFLHADVEENENIYVHMPRGFSKPGKVLKLKKTLYGLRQSPRAFWKYMVKKMADVGMKQSNLDPCLFVGEKVICICYVDDLLFWARDESDISKVAIQLRDVGVDLEQEDDAAGFLGVDMVRDPKTGLIEMKQTGLIKRIIDALGLDDGSVARKLTPSSGDPLIRDEDGDPFEGDFNYASVVGMLLYLSGHTRPDITYAVNCCARYMFNPKKRHEIAIKRIGRYLKGTANRGLIINPNKLTEEGLKIDCYPDADFAGLYGYENPSDPTCVKSRTGFLIAICGCPVLWQSKLQSETALSTMEAEIIALAHSCKELFPIMDLTQSLGQSVGLSVSPTTMHVSIHEDNAGALVLAETIPPQYTPRSKHYHTKTIWFREEIQKRSIKLLKIATQEQLGDMFTKGVPTKVFEYLRSKIMGW